jgi:PhnB protein
MPAVNPYLNFNGNCEEAFNFYKSAFGGEFDMISRFKDAPPGIPMPANEADKIMHVSFPIGKGTVLMGSDVPSTYGKTIFGQNVQISVSTDSEKETEKLFNALSAGGKINMPLEKTFWGSYFGMLTDKFDVNWMVSYTYNKK